MYVYSITLRVRVYVRGLRRRRESQNKEFSSKVSTKELASILVLCKASSRDPYIYIQYIFACHFFELIKCLFAPVLNSYEANILELQQIK